jgi:hypothetical protein
MLLGTQSTIFVGGETGYAYFFQVGATMGSVPQNSNWNLYLTNTQYVTTGSSTVYYLDHADQSTSYCTSSCGVQFIQVDSYWKENWGVSQNSAMGSGVNLVGHGTSSQNEIELYYNGLQNYGSFNLW